MKNRWVLNACMVLVVGVGLVSCTKEQIEQAMNRPAEVILQSSPCQPAGISSTATPEFCVNVTDIQLLNHDRQADVSLTLVNRTGRRLFIYASGTPSLTDSGGTKWSGGSNTGLGSGTHYPVTLEPNVETQGSFTFHQSGQATPDQIFSLRAEIVIMKVDSRGQPIPFTSAVTRGFNLSGIRLPQLPPQSIAPTEQKPDTKLAQVSPRGVEFAAPRTEKPDVLGIRLGMSPDEARLILKKQGFPLKPSDVSEISIEGLPNSRHIASIATYSKPLGTISLYFSAPPTPSGVIRLDRSVEYDRAAVDAPSEDNLLKALNEKFGNPTITEPGQRGRTYLIWMWTADGKPSPDTVHKLCRNLAGSGGPAATTVEPNVQRAAKEGCAWYVVVNYQTEGGVVKGFLQFLMFDYAGAAAASKATVQAAGEKILDRANKQKPAL
jgi:hypothetical protein